MVHRESRKTIHSTLYEDYRRPKRNTIMVGPDIHCLSKKTDVKITTSTLLTQSLKNSIDHKLSMSSNSERVINISHNIQVNDAVVENKAVMLETSEVTSVFALNHDGYTSDSTLVLPIDRLGVKYVIPSTEPHNSQHSDYNSQLAFGAVQDRTRVLIILKLKRGNTVKYRGKIHRNGDKFIVTLNKYQTFQLSHNGDLTGTLITSSKPVAVFSGNRCNKLNRFGFCSHLVEQIPPMDSLDTTYIVPPHEVVLWSEWSPLTLDPPLSPIPQTSPPVQRLSELLTTSTSPSLVNKQL